MMSLQDIVGLNIEVETTYGKHFEGYVDDFCSYDDNDDFEEDERCDAICLQIDEGGGVLLPALQIKSITISGGQISTGRKNS